MSAIASSNASALAADVADSATGVVAPDNSAVGSSLSFSAFRQSLREAMLTHSVEWPLAWRQKAVADGFARSADGADDVLYQRAFQLFNSTKDRMNIAEELPGLLYLPCIIMHETDKFYVCRVLTRIFKRYQRWLATAAESPDLPTVPESFPIMQETEGIMNDKKRKRKPWQQSTTPKDGSSGANVMESLRVAARGSSFNAPSGHDVVGIQQARSRAYKYLYTEVADMFQVTRRCFGEESEQTKEDLLLLEAVRKPLYRYLEDTYSHISWNDDGRPQEGASHASAAGGAASGTQDYVSLYSSTGGGSSNGGAVASTSARGEAAAGAEAGAASALPASEES